MARCECDLSRCIPYTETIALQESDVLEAREEKGVWVFRLVGTGNNTTRNDILFLVTFVGRDVDENPDVDPATRSLVLI